MLMMMEEEKEEEEKGVHWTSNNPNLKGGEKSTPSETTPTPILPPQNPSQGRSRHAELESEVQNLQLLQLEANIEVRKLKQNLLLLLLLSISLYAHMSILVLLILVPSFSFLAITPSHGVGVVRDLVGMNPTGPPDLSKPPRTFDIGQRT